MKAENSQAKSFEIFSSFFLDSTEVAINVKSVQEVVNFPEKIIPMPLAPAFLLGVFNLRGMIIPVINLRKLLHFENTEVGEHHKVAILEHEGARIGLIFDKTSEILRINPDDVCECSYADERSHQVVRAAIKLDQGERILQVIHPMNLLTIENIPQIIEQQKRLPSHTSQKLSVQDLKKCISFSVAGIKMAFEISGIHEIVQMMELQSSTMQNDYLLGVINLRKRIIPIVSFSKLLKMEDSKSLQYEDQRIIIIKSERELFGLVVDSVESINTFSKNELMPIPLLSNNRRDMFLGCIDLPSLGEVFVLNHQGILSGDEISEITQGHSRIYGTQEIIVEQKQKKLSRQSYISFRLKYLFGVSIGDIKEIINYPEDILQAPGLPHFVQGMLNLRGKLVTVIDTKLLYKMDTAVSVSSDSKILIFEKDHEMFGLVVDSVDSIITVDADKNMKLPSLMVQQVSEQFGNDIKEIVSVKNNEDKESALIILNMEPITSRIRNLVAA